MGQKVIVNMSAAISIYNLVFVAGMDRSNTYTGCTRIVVSVSGVSPFHWRRYYYKKYVV
ncbi:hypothetical protein DPMN_144041 [Dreissena polymorpha]|uniref:Uncharacterized protein n=1 Tax=Dreissena polymorpha TaxID=45954 RepID=A0A9D4GE61_DREPO|nr:hypothetical protein DPMN_144041 [Dreissena polymorpha]